MFENEYIREFKRTTMHLEILEKKLIKEKEYLEKHLDDLPYVAYAVNKHSYRILKTRENLERKIQNKKDGLIFLNKIIEGRNQYHRG